ncbi:hypothetical protein H4R23_002069, partial [Coemansia sp. Cherry 401B]
MFTRESGRRGAGVLERMRNLVDNVAEAFDGPAATRKDRLLENWTRIQEYYTPQRQDDLRRQDIRDTTIPHHLEGMLREVCSEILDETAQTEDQDGALAQALEFGACMEYLLQYHVLSDLVEFGEADEPRGMRKYVVRFFDSFVGAIPLGLLAESAIRLPLVAVMRQSLQVVETSPVTAVSGNGGEDRLGRGYHGVMRERAAVVLCHDLLQLIVTLFARLREHANMVHLFFDWGGGEGGNGSSGSSSDLAVAALRAAAAAGHTARGHELFLVHTIVEYLLAPGATGELAREALVLAVQVLLAPADSARFAEFLVARARVAELLVEHLGFLHAQMPVFRPEPRSPAARVFGADYAGPRRLPPLERRMRAHTADAPRHDIARRLRRLLARDSVLRSVAAQDQRDARVLGAARRVLAPVDAFFVCWELLDEVAAVAGDARVVAAVQSQLANGFLHTHVAPALLAARSQALTTVSYLADLVHVTHSAHVLDALLAVLLGPGLRPERAPASPGSLSVPSALAPEDQRLLDAIEDDALRAEAARLLLPPGAPAADARDAHAPHSVRAALIGWMTLDDGSHLALNTLRLFDAILASMSQFAYASLALRNFAAGERERDGAFYAGPALGRGESAAADQELVRAVVERFVDATPGAVAAAMPEAVVAAALRIDGQGGSQAPRLEPPAAEPLRNFTSMRALIMREARGCDDYVRDCLLRLRAAARYTALCWQSNAQFIDAHSNDAYSNNAHFNDAHSADAHSANAHSANPDAALAAFYPGAFLLSLVRQLALVPTRHMAYNLLLTSILNRLLSIAHPALCAYLFLANSATMPENPHALYLYDALVTASAEAYVKAERVPRFSARLARQLREGVETAVRVGAASPQPAAEPHQQQQPIVLNPKPARNRLSIEALAQHRPPSSSVTPARNHNDDNTPLAQLSTASAMDIDEAGSADSANKSRSETAAAARFLGTPIKRFVNAYIVLDEFGKEMAAMAMALHTMELDRQLDRTGFDPGAGAEDEYADLLEYFDPGEPAYRQAAAVRASLGADRVRRRTVIDLDPLVSGDDKR